MTHNPWTSNHEPNTILHKRCTNTGNPIWSSLKMQTTTNKPQTPINEPRTTNTWTFKTATHMGKQSCVFHISYISRLRCTSDEGHAGPDTKGIAIQSMFPKYSLCDHIYKPDNYVNNRGSTSKMAHSMWFMSWRIHRSRLWRDKHVLAIVAIRLSVAADRKGVIHRTGNQKWFGSKGRGKGKGKGRDNKGKSKGKSGSTGKSSSSSGSWQWAAL